MGQPDKTDANDLWVSTFELKNKSRKKNKTKQYLSWIAQK